MGQKKKPYQLTQLLFFGFSPLRRTEVEKIHRYYGKYYWKKANAKKKISLCKDFLCSPVTIAKRVYRESGGSPGKKDGLLRFYLAFFYDISPKDYDLLGFGRDKRGNLKKYYLQERALKYSLYKLLRQYGKHLYPSETKVYLGDKIEFYRYCSREKIPTVPLLNPEEPLPAKDLFIKPRIGKEGRGSQVWYYEQGLYKGAAGVRRRGEELKKELVGSPGEDGYGELILQPLVKPHEKLGVFYKHATPTIRVLTYMDSAGRIRVGPCMLRFNMEEEAITDNASTGGQVAAIEPERGVVEHPRALEIPYWEETREILLRAHGTMKDRILIGWDVLITDQGPLVLEGNSQPGLTHLQKAHGAGFGKTEMIKELGIHVENAWNRLKAR